MKNVSWEDVGIGMTSSLVTRCSAAVTVVSPAIQSLQLMLHCTVSAPDSAVTSADACTQLKADCLFL